MSRQLGSADRGHGELQLRFSAMGQVIQPYLSITLTLTVVRDWGIFNGGARTGVVKKLL